MAETLAAEGIPLIDLDRIDSCLTEGSDGKLKTELQARIWIQGAVVRSPAAGGLHPEEKMIGVVVKIVGPGSRLSTLPEIWVSGKDDRESLRCLFFLLNSDLLATLGESSAGDSGSFRDWIGEAARRMLARSRYWIRKWSQNISRKVQIPSVAGGMLIALGLTILALAYHAQRREETSSGEAASLRSDFEEKLQRPAYNEVASIMVQLFLRRLETQGRLSGNDAEGMEAMYSGYLRQRNILSRWWALRRFRKLARVVERGIFFGIDERKTLKLYRQLNAILAEVGTPEPLLEISEDAR